MSKPCPDHLTVDEEAVIAACLTIPDILEGVEKIAVGGSRGKTKKRHEFDKLARPDSDWDILVFIPSLKTETREEKDKWSQLMVETRDKLREKYKVYVDISIVAGRPVRSPHYFIWSR